MREIINIHDAKTHLYSIVDRVAAGAEVVIAKAGKPMARLSPIERTPKNKKLGMLKGRITVPKDFNAPLEESVAGDFEGL